jgi:O-antigen/teichoic acid export membrane protein
MGIESGVLQLSSERSGDVDYANRASNFGTRFGLKFNLLLVVVLLGIGMFAPLKIDGGRRILCALSLLPVFQLMFNMTSSYLRSQKRNQEYAKLQVINTVLFL